MTDDKKLRQLLLDAIDAHLKLIDAHLKLIDAHFKLEEAHLKLIDAHFKLEEAKKNREDARKAFGYAEAYQDDPRFITIDGKLWSVTVPYPNRDEYRDEYLGGDIIIKKLGDCL